MFSPNGLSWNSIAGCFKMYSANAVVTPEILKSNGPASLQLVLHPNGANVVGGLDIAFKLGEEHRRLPKSSFFPSFLPLFTRKAMGMYLTVQDKRIRESIAEWLKVGHIQTEIRIPIRDMNVWTSQEVFCDPHIRSLAEHDELNRTYQLLVDGFFSFPINLPGTRLWKAIRAHGGLYDALMRYYREFNWCKDKLDASVSA